MKKKKEEWDASFPASEVEAKAAIRTLLSYIGEDVGRPGLADTPERVVRAWDEVTAGYHEDPKLLLERDFPIANYDELICSPFIEFCSTCEHHLLPFTGYAHVAYVPSLKAKRAVGLSKMARLVDCFARRLQIQEQMTAQVADAMEEHLEPRGVAVVVTARHGCMSCRGVRKQRAGMVTSAMRGVFKTQPAARAEFFKLVELYRQGVEL